MGRLVIEGRHGVGNATCQAEDGTRQGWSRPEELEKVGLAVACWLRMEVRVIVVGRD